MITNTNRSLPNTRAASRRSSTSLSDAPTIYGPKRKITHTRMTNIPSRRSPTPPAHKTKARSKKRVAEEDSERTPALYSGLRGDLREQGKVPNQTQLAQMTTVDSIDWRTHGTEDITTYKLGDDVVVVPSSKAIGKRSRHELTEIELWRGRILEIRIPTSRTRSRNDNQANEQPKDVWVIVAWYYSPLTYKTMGVPTDQRGYRKGDFGKRELIFTPTHTDPVHIDTLNGTEAILDYDEKDYDQDDIPEEAFYKRSVYDTVHQIWEDGPPTRECICKQTFKVYDDQEMHYCPRAGCHKWYHEACLEKHDFMIRERALRKFEDEWEATFDEEWLGDIKEEVDALPRGNSIEIPKRLESYARRPIMKGGKHGVNGNAAATFRARWIIHQARKEVPIPDKYKDFCKYKRRSKSNGGAQAKERVRRSTMVHFEPYKQGPFLYCFICPSCKKAI